MFYIFLLYLELFRTFDDFLSLLPVILRMMSHFFTFLDSLAVPVPFFLGTLNTNRFFLGRISILAPQRGDHDHLCAEIEGWDDGCLGSGVMIRHTSYMVDVLIIYVNHMG